MEKIETMSENQKSWKPYQIGGYLFVGCMFIGMGIGKLVGSYGIGMYLGMGVGFICMAIAVLKLNKKNEQ